MKKYDECKLLKKFLLYLVIGAAALIAFTPQQYADYVKSVAESKKRPAIEQPLPVDIDALAISDYSDFEGEDKNPCLGAKAEKKGWGKEGSVIQTHALWISGCDYMFVHLLDNENGQWTKERVSDPHWCERTQKIERGYGLCQISGCYHPKLTTDIRMKNERWQLEQCYSLYRNGTRFYGADKGKSPNISFYVQS